MDRRYLERPYSWISGAGVRRRHFVYYVPFSKRGDTNCSHGDHAWPFLSPGQTTIDNPHNDAYRIPMLLYNPRIRNPQKRSISGRFYSLSLPTTILDLLVQTKSLSQEIQQTLAMTYAANYEYAQSLLRRVTPTIRLFQVSPGNAQWVLDNGSNLRVTLLASRQWLIVV